MTDPENTTNTPSRSIEHEIESEQVRKIKEAYSWLVNEPLPERLMALVERFRALEQKDR